MAAFPPRRCDDEERVRRAVLLGFLARAHRAWVQMSARGNIAGTTFDHNKKKRAESPAAAQPAVFYHRGIDLTPACHALRVQLQGHKQGRLHGRKQGPAFEALRRSDCAANAAGGSNRRGGVRFVDVVGGGELRFWR